MKAMLFGLALVAGVAALLALAFPDQFAVLGRHGWANLVYLLGAILVMASPLFGWKRRAPEAKEPGIVTSALIWLSLFALVVLAYRAGSIWSQLIELANSFTR